MGYFKPLVNMITLVNKGSLLKPLVALLTLYG